MLKPVKMKKLSAIVIDEKKDKVLRELKERGVIQFLDVKESHVFKEFKLSTGQSVIKAEASEYISKTDSLLENFKATLQKKGSMAALDAIFSSEEKVPVKEIHQSELFDNAEDKLFSLGDKISTINSRLEQLKKEKEDLSNAQKVISKLENIRVGPKDLLGYKKSLLSAGIMPSSEIEKFKAEISKATDLFAIYSKELTKRDSTVIVVALRKSEVDIAKAMRLHKFEEIHVPLNFAHLSLDDALEKIKSELSAINKEEEGLLNNLMTLLSTEAKNLLVVKESLQIEKLMDDSNSLFGKTFKTYLIQGWSPEYLVGEAAKVIENASDGYCVTSIEDPEEEDEPPTLLNNPPQTEGLEIVTKSYGDPSYHELDPTSIVAFTFPLIFGMMFGDVGHGIMLFLLGYFLAFRLNASKIIKKLGKTLLLCGISAAIFGGVYGAAFGLEELIPPLWKSPRHHVTDALGLAMKVGAGLLILAFTLHMTNEAMHKKYAEAIVSIKGFAGIWLILGGASMLMHYGTDIFAIAKDPLFIPAILLPVIFSMIGEWKISKMPLFMAFFEVYENFFRYLVNGISFMRVAILAITHEALGSIVVLGMNMAPPTTVGLVVKAIVFALGNIFVFAIEMFVSFIQTLRLHYYEWFSKFYSGKGETFNPFKAERRYTYIVEKV